MQFNLGSSFTTIQPNDAVWIFASHKRYGGGYRNHSKAQEEWCFNNSTLPHTPYPEDFYPVSQSEVSGFVNKATTISGVDFNAVFVPAPLHPASSYLIQSRVNLAFELAEKCSKRFIIGAWGCGVFRNPKDKIAAALKTAINSSKLEIVFNTISQEELDFFRSVLES